MHFHAKRRSEQQPQCCSAIQAVHCTGSESLTATSGFIQLSCEPQSGTSVCSHLQFVPLAAGSQTNQIGGLKRTGAVTVSSSAASFTASSWGIKPSFYLAPRSSAVMCLGQQGHLSTSVAMALTLSGVKTNAR